MRTRTDDRDRGSASIEMVLLAPAFLLVLALMIACGRFAIARQHVDAAAFEASRSASLERNRDGARSAAANAASFAMDDSGTLCQGGEQTRVDLSEWGRAIGQTTVVGEQSMVRVSVTCPVRLSDLGLPGVNAAVNITGTSESPIDRFRVRN